MPGRIAPAYVAVDANRLPTGAGAGWFGGGVRRKKPVPDLYWIRDPTIA